VKALVGVLTCCLLLAFSGETWAQAGMRRVIIDTDPGVDDAFALLLAMRSPELHIEAITVVAGNVPVDVGLKNALRLVEIAGRTGIPVARGADAPLVRRLVTATYAHGDNGLGGIEIGDPVLKPAAAAGATMIADLIRQHPEEISLVCLGPLTNIAAAFRSDPSLPKKIKEIVLMGGSMSGGNVTPAAEFNIYVDPEAARIVFHSGAPVVMVGLDVTRKALLREEDVRRLESGSDPVARLAARLGRNGVERSKRAGGRGPAMHDPLAMAVLLDKSIVQREKYYVDVETAGELTAGETLVYRRPPLRRSAPWISPFENSELQQYQPNVEVATDVEPSKFFDLFIGRLTSSRTISER